MVYNQMKTKSLLILIGFAIAMMVYFVNITLLDGSAQESKIDLQKITLSSHPRILTNETLADGLESLSSHPKVPVEE